MIRAAWDRKTQAFYAAFGARIKIAREVRGLSQGQLAKVIGVDRSQMSNIENGYSGIPLHRLVLAKKRLGVSYNLLIEGTSTRGRI